MAQWVKNPPAVKETPETLVWSLGQEDPLEKEMATHTRILAWEIPWTEEPGELQSKGSQRVRQDWATKHILFFILSPLLSSYFLHFVVFLLHKAFSKHILRQMSAFW